MRFFNLFCYFFQEGRSASEGEITEYTRESWEVSALLLADMIRSLLKQVIPVDRNARLNAILPKRSR